MKKETQGLTVKKSENFSEWFSQVIQKAKIVDIRFGVKGFIIIREWGTMIIEKMYDFYEEELQKRGHKPVMMPSVIPESNLKKESSHVEGFTPEVFWLKTPKEEERLALRPTSETVFTPMFAYWVRSHNDLPLKLYQRGSVFRLDTKATRPLIRGREFNWIEAHGAFATREESEAQVKEDIEITETVMHNKFGIPFLPLKRPQWDKFPGAEYTIGSDVPMPDGKVIQQPSTHLMGQKFSKAFGAKFVTKSGEEDYLWTTAYGPAISRILVNVISMHGDDKGLVLPYCISPVKVVIIPIYTKQNKNKILNYAKKVENELEKHNIKTELDDRDNYSPGWKYNEWELNGVPFRIEIGNNEFKDKNLTLFFRNSGKKTKILLKNLKNIKKLGEKFDLDLRNNADRFMNGKIVGSKNFNEIKKAVNSGKISKINFCSINGEGLKCAEQIKEKTGAEVRGVMANKKEKASGNCIICGKMAGEVVYIGKSY